MKGNGWEVLEIKALRFIQLKCPGCVHVEKKT